MSNNNDKNHACSNTENTVNARKRKVPEEEDYHGVVVRSSGNPRFSANASDHPLRSGIGHESRIVRVSRSSGGKDRHSKVLTAKGLRDRRVRLSVSTAIQFYDLQDRLGFDQPSKAVEWLIKAAANAIDELPPLDSPLFRTISNDPHIPNPHHPYTNNNVNIASNKNPQGGDSGPASGGINAFAESSSALGMSPTNDSQSSREGQEGQCEMIKPKARETLGKRKMSSNSTNSEEGGEEEEREGGGGGIKGMQETYYSALSLSRSESRVKAREHARERAKGKSQIPATAAAASVVVRDSDGTRDSFTGLLNSVAQVALESRDIDENTRDGLEKRRTLCLSMNIMDHNPPNPHPHVATPPPHIDHLFHDPPHQHILHSGSAMHQQSQSFPFSTFINAAIFSPLSLQRSEMTKPTSAFSTCQEQKHRPDHLFGNMGHFASNPSVQQQQQHHGSFLLSVDQETHEQQQFVPTISHDHMNLISFSMPGLSGRETLQSNSDNGMVYHMPSTHQRIQSAADQTQHNSMFEAMRNANNLHGGLDAQSLQSSIQDFDAQTSRSPAVKGNKKHGNQNQYN